MKSSIILFLAALVLLFVRLGMDELKSADEAIHAQVAREMARDGHWLYPTYRGEPYLEKPPLKFWLTALTFKLAGESEFTARFMSALFGLGAVLGMVRLGNILFNRRAGLAASLVLLTTWDFLFNHCSRTGELDSALLFFLILSVAALWKARMEGNSNQLYASAFWMAMGFLIKGHIILISLLWLPLVWRVGPKIPVESRLAWPHFIRAALIFLILALPWFILQTFHYGWNYLDYNFRHNVLGYTLGRVEDAETSVRFYLEEYLWRDYPWPPLAMLGGLMLFDCKLIADFAHASKARFWLWSWLGVEILVLTLSKTKLPWYHLPALIPLSLMAGLALERWWSLGSKVSMRWNWLWLGFHLGIFFLLAGFWISLRDWGLGWIHHDSSELKNFAWYFLRDSAQRSFWVALIVLPVGLLAWLKAERFVRIRAPLLAIAAVLLGFLEIFRLVEPENARGIVRNFEKTLLSRNVPVHLFDAYHEQAPHYVVSPALYYYLAASSKLQIQKHPLDQAQWRQLLETHPSGVAVIPLSWMKPNLPVVPIDIIHEAQLVFLGVPPGSGKFKPLGPRGE